ncbi:MAG TPA: 5-(carboxyamino)imidazole ribonucleotide synthase [Acidobacteriaceae bacterium]|jgi:5-(carboxyamino)imidazole ribonucleotide synthase|nr:5-(carboxyamino)imidazole ribonucleotide synthase [Acidobacteriaceae bacterium]
MSTQRPRAGILGAGQLALMLAEAGAALNVDVICAGRHGDCAERVVPVVPVDLHDATAVAAFAAQVDAVTVESENIDARVLRGLNLYPNAHAIGIAQDRLLEKRFFVECGLEVAPFAPVDSLDDLERAIERIGAPAILKTRRMGYDGKGQVRLQAATDAAYAWSALGGVPCILEGVVPFEAEVSLIAARGRSGETVFYPLTENVHREGILRVSRAPAWPELQPQAESYLRHLLDRLDYVGVLAVEFFVRDGHLLANEMAPRVHNSGHWTIEGSATSQFENCLRAMLGMPLGSTASQPTVMLNCIGSMPPEGETRAFPRLARHDYGKAARPGRKVGHLTLPASDEAAVSKWETRLNPNG